MNDQTLHYVAEELLGILPQINKIMASEVHREIGDMASVSQLRLMGELKHGPQTLSSLARHRQVSPQALCNLTQDLVERGWLSREPHPNDRRQQLLVLTDAGRETFIHARLRALEQIIPLLADLDQAELAAVQAALPALQRVLSTASAHAVAGQEPGKRV